MTLSQKQQQDAKKKQRSTRILKQVIEESILMSECSSPRFHRFEAPSSLLKHDSSANTLLTNSNPSANLRKMTEQIVKKVDLSRICNFVSASQFNEVQTLKAKIEVLEKENDELTHLNREMNEFRQALNYHSSVLNEDNIAQKEFD